MLSPSMPTSAAPWSASQVAPTRVRKWRGHPHHGCGDIDGAVQRDGAEVRSVGIAVLGRIQVGSGVADQGDLVNGELGAGSVVIT